MKYLVEEFFLKKINIPANNKYIALGETVQVRMAALAGAITVANLVQETVSQITTCPSVPDINNKLRDLQKSIEYNA